MRDFGSFMNVRQMASITSGLSFFLQAEDDIRYLTVTGVQTCALPISPEPVRTALYDITLTAAAVNLDPGEQYEACLREVAGWLKVQHADTALRKRIEFLQR